MPNKRPDNIALRPDRKAVVIIDQTLLPNEQVFLELTNLHDMVEAILLLRVRGAPAIGICAAYCYAVLAGGVQADAYDAFYQTCRENGAFLNAARPTAVNLSWAIHRMDKLIGDNPDLPVTQLKEKLFAEAVAIQDEDVAMCAAIAHHGLTLLQDGDGVLTHCNAGPLATSLYGTALGPMLLAKEQGMDIKVFADETRPLLQGARLTAYELQKAGVDVTLICDNMASIVMQNGWVNACFVGCDRVAANGDAANKIGTSGVAILAKHYGIPFYVLGPTSTIDMACPTGADIEIELRAEDEIRRLWYAKPMAPQDVKCYNPAFDVTDHSLISGIVTQHGVCRPPYKENLAKLFAK